MKLRNVLGKQEFYITFFLQRLKMNNTDALFSEITFVLPPYNILSWFLKYSEESLDTNSHKFFKYFGINVLKFPGKF